MSETNERCEWSDLDVRSCAHCGAAPGDRPTLAYLPPMRHPEPERPESALPKPKLPDTWAPSSEAGECRCGQTTRDSAWLCDPCQKRFTATLEDLGPLDDELTVTITRQRAAAITGGPPSASTGLPWHETAADALRTLHGLLAQWVRFSTEEEIRGPSIAYPADTIDSMAAWLVTRVHGLALNDIGPEAMDEITDAAAECHRIVFWKRRSRIYLGTCRTTEVIEDENGETYETPPCPGEIYAEEDEPVGFCDLCKQGATVVIRRTELNKELDAYLATAAEIARLATYLGLDVPRDTVRKRVLYWHRHKRIPKRGADPAGLPMFRYGEARKLLYEDFARRAG